MKQVNKGILLFTVPIIILVVVASLTGLIHSSIYSKETANWYVQTIGQDISNLFVITPLLLISALFALKGSRGGALLWFGVMITNVYSFLIYAFALHFNPLFYIYCAILGLSIYSVIYFISKMKMVDFKSWFHQTVHEKSTGLLLIALAVCFALIWLSDSLPAALANRTPESITKAGLLSNPVHVLDFSFYLPLMVLAGVWLFQKRSSGYLLAPAMLIFSLLTAVNIISLMLVTMWHLHTNTWPAVIVFTILASLCAVAFIAMMKRLAKII
ncbi:hypothetical protein M3N64_09010 [Sporolactobacillus sp. CPB3-1]|uniref:Uncharacterized protein n=1 Tax=Sporolactobacillus mangiferae TaxID=2940498 RepID=A0ABT0MCW0_9BACL|nr:hypothetical protein [Sporolactobacillus mangiferae]MCL1632089.1 hypothetical protein [Sporolactobacillus mangiferae]